MYVTLASCLVCFFFSCGIHVRIKRLVSIFSEAEQTHTHTPVSSCSRLRSQSRVQREADKKKNKKTILDKKVFISSPEAFGKNKRCRLLPSCLSVKKPFFFSKCTSAVLPHSLTQVASFLHQGFPHPHPPIPSGLPSPVGLFLVLPLPL